MRWKAGNLVVATCWLLAFGCGGSDVDVGTLKKELSDLKSSVAKVTRERDNLRQKRDGLRKERDSLAKQLAQSHKTVAAKKGPQPEITRHDFYSGLWSPHEKGIMVKGIVKNTGDQAARNIVVQVVCSGCSRGPGDNNWFTRMDTDRTRIDHLGAGEQKEFEITFARVIDTEKRLEEKAPPTGLEVKILSHDAVK